jgi:hypothetical protein
VPFDVEVREPLLDCRARLELPARGRGQLARGIRPEKFA